ncbi:hypothetical protein GBAR_LOCUS19325, partial [Geodia barretti]
MPESGFTTVDTVFRYDTTAVNNIAQLYMHQLTPMGQEKCLLERC